MTAPTYGAGTLFDPALLAGSGMAALTDAPRGFPRVRPPVFVACGNSIAAFSLQNSTFGAYFNRSETSAAIQFAGPIVRQLDGCDKAPGYTTTNFDPAGNFGDSSQALDTITSVAISTWFPILDYAGIVPDIILGQALIENDIYLGASSATIKTRIQNWITLMWAKFPGVIIHLCTSRPDGRIMLDPVRMGVADDTYAYMMGLDDGRTIFVTDLSYSPVRDPNLRWAPLPGYCFVSALNESLTRQDGVHPRENAACINGRLIAATWRRIVGGEVSLGVSVQSSNLTLTGTAAVNTLQMLGTAPTNCSPSAAPAGAAAKVASTALQPGWRLVFTADPGTPVDSLIVQLNNTVPAAMPKRLSLQGQVTINSGSACLSSLTMRAYIYYTDSTNELHYVKYIGGVSAGGIVTEVFQDGDVINLQSAPITVTAGKTVSMVRLSIVEFINGLTPVDTTINSLGLVPLSAPVTAQAITVTASPFVYQNTGSSPVDAIVTGGTVSDVSFSRDGTTYFSAGTTSIVMLSPGDFVKVTYSAAPTMTAVPR